MAKYPEEIINANSSFQVEPEEIINANSSFQVEKSKNMNFMFFYTKII